MQCLFLLYCSSLLKYNAQEIKWEKIKVKEDLNNKNEIKWEKYYPEPMLDQSEIDSIGNKYQKNLKVENKEISTKEFFYLGFAVPNAFLTNNKDFMILEMAQKDQIDKYF